MKFEIIIPTYKRLGKLLRLMESVYQTVGDRYADVKSSIWFDNKDWQTCREFRHTAQYKRGFGVGVMTNVIAEHLGVFGIFNRFLQYYFNSDVAICIPDDTEWINGGLKQAMEFYEQNYSDTDYVVGLQQDLITKCGGNKGAVLLIGRKFMERFPDRHCYCPLYECWCADDELGRFARKVGRFYYLGNPPLIRHYTNEHTDETNAMNEGLRQADLKLRDERKAKGILWGEK